jgi:hypothetical protein
MDSRCIFKPKTAANKAQSTANHWIFLGCAKKTVQTSVTGPQDGRKIELSPGCNGGLLCMPVYSFTLFFPLMCLLFLVFVINSLCL